MGSLTGSLTDSLMVLLMGSLMVLHCKMTSPHINVCCDLGAVLLIITEKHVAGDDILFTNHLTEIIS